MIQYSFQSPFCAVAAVLLMASSTFAQVRGEIIASDLINDVDQSTVALHTVTPYMESSTMLLADIDMTKIDVEATMDWLNESAGIPKNQQGVAMIQGFLQSLLGGGVDHIYVTASMRSLFDGGPLVVIPCQNPAVVNGLATVVIQQVPANPPQKVATADGIVLVGATAVVDRVGIEKGVERPDLILPLKHADRLDHAIVIALPNASRQELVALWPDRMPPQSPIQFSPRSMAADVVSVVISWSLPPDPEVLVRIETTDAGSAERLMVTLDDAFEFAGKAKSSIEMKVEDATVRLRARPEDFAAIATELIAPARKRASQVSRMNTMKQIGLAIHNYYDRERHLPPRCLTDDAANPLLSWRVALLPYVEQVAMYRAMQLDKAWDDEANSLQTATAIGIFCDPPGTGPKTTFRAPVFPGSLWDGEGDPKTFQQILDGTSNTIAVIDAPESAAIEWANPEPWVISADDPMSDVFGDRDTVTVLLLDGVARVLKKEGMTNEKLKAMLTIAGKENVE